MQLKSLNQSMINKYILKAIFSIFLFSFVSVNVFSAVVDSSESVKSIPFKTEHSAINDAASTFPYVFLVFILFIGVLFFIKQKVWVYKYVEF